jgi:sugar phosphate permease
LIKKTKNINQLGARGAVSGALLFLGGTLALTSLLVAEWQMWLLFGVLGGAAFGCLNLNVFAAAITRYVAPAHRSMATGVALTGSTVGQLTLVPAFALLAGTGDGAWRTGYQVAAAACVVMATVCCVVLAPRPGSEHKSEGGEASEDTEAQPVTAQPALVLPISQKLRQLGGSRHFWALGLAFTICGRDTRSCKSSKREE